ncbi:hypothetical protein B0H11DRAFT_2379088 [Mycena galericulata]|nr:hypothetical protein B0H11DRAFT_2379088 [Mycena galericulata]
MVQDKILSGLSSTYSPIITLLQAESPQRDVPSMINTINAWERTDLQRSDSVIKAARAAKVIDDANQGGAFAAAHLTHRSRHSDSSHSHSRSSAGKEFDWTNTKNRTDVCYRCGLPGHFAQYCVSVMPDDVRRRIVRDCEQRAHTAEAERDSESADEPSNHAMSAVLDLPTELHIDTMDPVVRDAWLSTLGNTVRPVPQHFANAAVFPDVNPGPSPPSPTLTASSFSSTPTKKKNKKKKKKKKTSATVNDIQSAFKVMSLEEAEEDEYSM